MHSQATVAEALRLRSAGLNNCEISRRVAVPRPTIREWSSGRLPRSCAQASSGVQDSSAYVYLLGLYLGDGCISTHPRGVYRLRITLDVRYPAIVQECESAVQAVLPLNRVGRHLRPCNCYEVSAYSKSWPRLLPQHGSGRKHERKIVLADWQQELGALSPDLLLQIFCDACDRLDIHWTAAPPKAIYVSRKADVARLDEFVGPKR